VVLKEKMRGITRSVFRIVENITFENVKAAAGAG
jgi:hypothetical protein